MLEGCIKLVVSNHMDLLFVDGYIWMSPGQYLLQGAV
jgi:hypothetical protein